LAVGRAIACTGREVIVLEAESAIGMHTSSRNSEVIHAGIYYPTGSMKAKLCVRGNVLLYEYCRERGIEHRRIGKLIVAITNDDIQVLSSYQEQAARNGVGDLRWLDAGAVATIEPQIECRAALFSPSTGIIDSHEYMLALQADIEARGGSVVCESRVERVTAVGRGFAVHLDTTDGYALQAELLVNSAGLWASDVAASIDGLAIGQVPRHRYARGHYYTLTGKAPFSHLVYPVAGNSGLGVHLTLDLAGQGRFGPDVQWVDNIDYTFDDSRKQSFVEAIRRYYPGLDPSALVPGYTGIRPKLGGPTGDAADFEIHGPEHHGVAGLVNLYGIESPGLTSSLAIADKVVAALVSG
jgi:L-2-hydroxyglutarate oxidase LhgO